MKKQIFVILIFFPILLSYSSDYELSAGTKGNRIALSVINSLPIHIMDAELYIKSAPSWLRFDVEAIRIPYILPNQKIREVFIFSVQDDAINKKGNVWFTLRSSKGVIISEHSIDLYTSAKMCISKLLTIYPNPSNTSFKIPFVINKASRVKIQIYNVLGQIVRTLVDQDIDIGKWEFEWDGKDNDNFFTPSGLYFVVLEVVNDEGWKRYSSRIILEK